MTDELCSICNENSDGHCDFCGISFCDECFEDHRYECNFIEFPDLT